MGAWSPEFHQSEADYWLGGKKWIKHVIISHFQKIMTDFGSRLVPELHALHFTGNTEQRGRSVRLLRMDRLADWSRSGSGSAVVSVPGCSLAPAYLSSHHDGYSPALGIIIGTT